jgi:NAD(P)H-quinone oxidoreductase subunit 4
LRQVFYETQNLNVNEKSQTLTDAKPREIFITACLLLPVIGIGLYPKVVTQTYDVKTVAVTTHVQESLPLIAKSRSPLYASALKAPSLPEAQTGKLPSVSELNPLFLATKV